MVRVAEATLEFCLLLSSCLFFAESEFHVSEYRIRNWCDFLVELVLVVVRYSVLMDRALFCGWTGQAGRCLSRWRSLPTPSFHTKCKNLSPFSYHYFRPLSPRPVAPVYVELMSLDHPCTVRSACRSGQRPPVLQSIVDSWWLQIESQVFRIRRCCC